MFERYTEKARRTIFFGRYEASQFGTSGAAARGQGAGEPLPPLAGVHPHGHYRMTFQQAF
jgi:hypothetical protein